MKQGLISIQKTRVWKVLALVGLLAGAVLLGLFAFVFVRGLVFPWGGGAAQGRPEFSAGQATQAVNEQGTPLPAAEDNPNLPQSVVELTPWDGASRVSVLLLGLDYRDWEAGDTEASRSDTMVLLTLDPLTKSAGVLSIPRDLWVAIPGFQHGKINTAYYLGDAYKLPGGGPALAVKTVEQFLGVPINFYAQVDFDAFVRFIDEIGGVEVDVPDPIKIDLLGDGPKTIKNLKPGRQVLPGAWALAYARNRKTENGDFDRARRTQQVILGVRDRILDFDMLPSLISKAPTLYNELASGIHTNLELDQAIKLALLAKDVPNESIQQGVFDQRYVVFGRSPDDLSILIPIPDKIHLLRDEIFAGNSSVGPATPGDARQQMQAEAAAVALYNGSSDPDLGNRAAEYLRSQGMNVASVGAAGEPYRGVVVVDHTGNPYAVKYLVSLLGIRDPNIEVDWNPNSAVEVDVYLGEEAVGVVP